MFFRFRANFDSFCEILDHLEQFWGSDHCWVVPFKIWKKRMFVGGKRKGKLHNVT